MRCDWTDLRAELGLWRQQNRVLPFWWRDDDAVEPTEALGDLHALSVQTGVPVHLAIVPKFASPELAAHMNGAFVPVMHGWAHANNAPQGMKKAEFGEGRDPGGVQADLKAGWARMRDVFADDFSHMFVPPWNRLDGDLLPYLKTMGFTAVSTYLPRKVAEPVAGLVQINTHIDPIFWRGSSGLVAPDTLIAHTVGLLRDRRLGRADKTEPLGYLTHHLVHDAQIWEFSRQFVSEICDGPLTLYRHDRKDIA